MNKYPLIGGSICAVVLIVLASLTNVVGYQTVQTSNQKIITAEVNEKDLLFQIMVDISNNKEIQRVILGSEIKEKRFFDFGMRFSVFTPPVLTEKFLKHAYTMGVILLKTISKSKIQSMIKQYQMSNQGVQKKINAVIEKDAVLKGETTQLSSLSCDCGKNNTTGWNYPVLCLILLPIAYCILIPWYIIVFILHRDAPKFLQYLFDTMPILATKLNCFWTY